MYFFDKNTKKTAFFIISVFIPVKEFRSIQTWQSLRDVISVRIRVYCLCVYAYVRMALAIMPTSHTEVIIRSHCYVIWPCSFSCQIGNNLRGLDRAITQVINWFLDNARGDNNLGRRSKSVGTQRSLYTWVVWSCNKPYVRNLKFITLCNELGDYEFCMVSPTHNSLMDCEFHVPVWQVLCLMSPKVLFCFVLFFFFPITC